MLAVLDVPEERIPTADASFVVEQRCAARMKPAVSAVGAAHAEGDVNGLARLPRAPPLVQHRIDVVLMNDGGPSERSQLREIPTDEIQDALVEILQTSIAITHRNHSGDGLDEPSEGA